MASVDCSSITDTHGTYDLDDELFVSGGSTASPARTLQTAHIYGRTRETMALLETFHRLRDTKKAQVVVVHGESGSGKTALVDTLRDPVFDADGYFVMGKYFQKNSTVQEPYSAIMAAFSDLCDLVVQSEDFSGDLQGDIANALGSNAQILANSISNLSALVGDLNEVDIEASFGKFKVACRTFLHAMASERHPVVVFLDDIQWADEGSTQLIKVFLEDSELVNVMFILAYRDEESEQIVETRILACLRDKTEIALSNLNSDSVYQMVTAYMDDSSDRIRQLSDLITKRTNGNPMHVMVLMKTIEQEALLLYDREKESWTFKVDEIQEAIMVSETLADLLLRKIKRLPGDLEELLKVASLLGYRFSKSILVKVASITIEQKRSSTDTMGSSQHEPVTSLLSKAVQEGFIEKTDDGFQFTHDKLQSSFRSLIGESEEAQLHLKIGEAFLALLLDDKSNIYRAAVHLNCAPGFLYNDEQRAKLARMNLEAAKYCEEVISFDKAVIALQTGLGVLGDERQWSEEHFDLTFEMMEALAKNQLIIGDFEACKETTSEALRHSKTTEANANLFLIDVEACMAGNEVEAALLTANRALNAIGVKVPRKAKTRHVLAKLIKVKYMLTGKTDEDVLNLPFMDDNLTANAVKLLMHICTNCFLKNEADTAVFSALLATELTLKRGLTQHSSCAFAIYGVAEVTLGNIDRAYRFGKLALALLARTNCREAECSTVAYALTMLSFRKEQLCDLISPLYNAANSGFQYGHTLYATYGLAQCYSMHIQIGTHLTYLEASMRTSYRKVYDLGQDAHLMWMQPGLQYILNMRSSNDSWEDITKLNGEIMNEEDYIYQARRTNQDVHVLVLLMWKAKLAIDFRQVALAAELLGQCNFYDTEGMRISYGAPPFFFDQARVHYNLFADSGQGRYLREARRYKRLLQRMSDAGCPSATSRLAFLVAQEGALVQKNYSAYERGIQVLFDSKEFLLEGHLNEMAGFDFAKRGLQAEAQRYFNRALYIFETECGAMAKYYQLEQLSRVAYSVQLPVTGARTGIPESVGS